MIRSMWGWAAFLAGVGLCLGQPAGAAEKKAAKETKKPQVEVVFCLDTTGSMGGLIEAAKQKIWSISNQVASGKPTPALKVGLVAYRDKGDAYITQVFDLTDDLDAVYGNLKKFQAQGGGDGPEHVNQALFDAVHKIKWGSDPKALRIVFLVGDAPPHMDYTDDVKYPETCKKAAARGIIINSIQCGGDATCARIWRDIASKAEGTYVQIAQTGGVVAVATPFDKRLGEINTELAGSTLVFGRGAMRKEADKKAGEARRLAGAAPGAAAERAGYLAKSGKGAAYDLLTQIKDGKVKLEELKEAELPDELKKIKPSERKPYLEKLEKRRQELRKEVLDLDKKRSEFIKKELEKKGKGKDGFDNQVLDMLRKQAKKAHIDY
jgi:Mg-chelatase subunit ChlD